MIEAFNIVRGAVSEKDLIPVLTHFAYEKGRIHGFNGRVHISAPVKLPESFPSFTVSANLLMAAMDACPTDPGLAITDNLLYVASGKFLAKLSIGNIAEYPVPSLPPAPAVKVVKGRKKKVTTGGLLPVLETLRPFIGEDASRPWCASIRFQDRCAYATNNVVLAALPLPENILLTTCALPVHAVDELLRLKLEPVSIVEDGDHALVFYFPGDVWMKTSLIADEWPDVGVILANIHAMSPVSWVAVADTLLDAVNSVLPFCPDPKLPAIVLDDDTVTTRAGASTASAGGFKGLAGTYHVKALQQVLGSATGVAWGLYPRVPWVGEGGLMGALVGLKL